MDALTTFKIFGPHLDADPKPLKSRKALDYDVHRFLEKVFSTDIGLLINDETVFMINLDNYEVLEVQKSLRFLKNLQGFRKIDKNKISLVYYDQKLIKTLFIKKLD